MCKYQIIIQPGWYISSVYY